MSIRRLASISCIALALLALWAGGALAASINIAVGADPTEEVPVSVTLTWTSSVAPEVYAYAFPAGSLTACPATFAAAQAQGERIAGGDTYVQLAGTKTDSWRVSDPGSYLVCGYMQNGSVSLASTPSPLTVTFRAATGSIAIQAPARVDPGSAAQVGLAVTSELRREVMLTYKPAGGRPCGATYALDEPGSETLISANNSVYAQGTQRPTVTWNTNRDDNTTYLLCAYLQESSLSATATAVAQATVLVGPDPCLAARAALSAAGSAVHTAERSVNRNRAAYRNYRRKAARAHGARRRALRNLARRANSRYRSALRRRALARARFADAQQQVTRACPAG